jgi:hypothetical protein
LPRPRFVEGALYQMTGAPIVKLIRERERLFEAPDDLAALLPSIDHDAALPCSIPPSLSMCGLFDPQHSGGFIASF